MKKEIFKKLFNDMVLFFKNNPVIVVYFFGNLINALVLRLLTTGSIGGRAIFFDAFFILVLLSLGFLIKKKSRLVYYYFTTLIMVAICVINSIYYNYYASYASVSLLATSVFVKDVGDAAIAFALKITDWVYLWIFVGLFIANKKNTTEYKVNKGNFLKTLFISLAALGIGWAIPPYTSWSRLVKLWNRVSVVNVWGPYIYQMDDIVQSLKPTFNNMFGYDTALKDTKDYYANNNKVQSINKYTGIFEGKNVIAIHAESLQAFTLGLEFNGEEVTPNINKIINVL